MCRSLGVVKILEAVTKCFVSFTSLNTIVKKMNTNLKHGINFILALDIYLFIFFFFSFLFPIFLRCWDHKLWIYRWNWHIREIGTASVILCDSFYLNWMTHTHTHKTHAIGFDNIDGAHFHALRMRWFSSQICNQLSRKIPPNLRFSRLVFTFDFHPLKKKLYLISSEIFHNIIALQSLSKHPALKIKLT